MYKYKSYLLLIILRKNVHPVIKTILLINIDIDITKDYFRFCLFNKILI